MDRLRVSCGGHADSFQVGFRDTSTDSGKAGSNLQGRSMTAPTRGTGGISLRRNLRSGHLQLAFYCERPGYKRRTIALMLLRHARTLFLLKLQRLLECSTRAEQIGQDGAHWLAAHLRNLEARVAIIIVEAQNLDVLGLQCRDRRAYTLDILIH